MKTPEQIQVMIDYLNEALENIVDGSVTEGLYVGQVSALEWVLKD